MKEMLEYQPRRAPGVLSQKVKPDAPSLVLLNPKSGEYYTLDEVGTRVWALCDGAQNVPQIASVLAKEFDAPVEVIQEDLLDLLKELMDEGLLVPPP